MSRWGDLIPHDEEAAEQGRCLCGCCDETDSGCCDETDISD